MKEKVKISDTPNSVFKGRLLKKFSFGYIKVRRIYIESKA